jgi:hypothetical protein
MKNTDLRIGNKLQKDNGEIFTVLRIDNTNDVLVEEQRGLLTLDYNLFGIPLTEDWLLKFGFEKTKVRGLYDNSFLMHNVLKSDLYFRPSYQGGYYWGFITPDSITASEIEHEFYDAKPVQYVHQLQNLYFALTGEELTLK